jgi:hypothetical protein
MIKLALNIERTEKLIELLKSDANIELETLVLKDDILF